MLSGFVKPHSFFSLLPTFFKRLWKQCYTPDPRRNDLKPPLEPSLNKLQPMSLFLAQATHVSSSNNEDYDIMCSTSGMWNGQEKVQNNTPKQSMCSYMPYASRIYNSSSEC
eukprot:5755214-Amphidinium_carterae.2